MSNFFKIETKLAPKAVGPYSQAVIFEKQVFCSGQIAIAYDGKIIDGDIKVQTRKVIENIKEILIAAESNLDQIIKTEIYLKNMDDFAVMNEVYSEYFKVEPLPARVTVEVSRLPKDSLIEMSCLAYKK